LPIHHSSWAEQLPLLDYRGLDWSTVRRTRFFCYQRFHYVYPGPIRYLHQRLMLIPPDRYGDQTVVEHELTTAPHPAHAQQHVDVYGNRVWDMSVERVDNEIAFEAIMTLERSAEPRTQLLQAADVAPYREATRLPRVDERMRTAAHDLSGAAHDAEDLAERISAWVAGAMQYGSGATGVNTTATHALAGGKGLCQDYAHIMLAMCRSVDIPARYVSGHMLAEGGSHAWVEVLLPQPDGRFRAVGFDPTNRRRPNFSYAIVAVGRDYCDVAPTSGSFTAPYSGRLGFTKRAGLTRIEFTDGRVLDSRADARALRGAA
jgi:transglutaminase-like putative cysteine protease